MRPDVSSILLQFLYFVAEIVHGWNLWTAHQTALSASSALFVILAHSAPIFGLLVVLCFVAPVRRVLIDSPGDTRCKHF